MKKKMTTAERAPDRGGGLMRTYSLSFTDSLTHVPDHPERTATKQGAGTDLDIRYQVWPSRAAMLKTIELQARRAPRATDWRAWTDTRAGKRSEGGPA